MIYPVRKMGEGQNEILILLRNPYGGDSEAYKRMALWKRDYVLLSLRL